LGIRACRLPDGLSGIVDMIALVKQVYTIDPALSLLYGVGFGSVEARDIMRNQYLIWHDPLRRADMKIIYDATLVTDFNFERTDIDEQVELNRWMTAQGRSLEPTAIIGREHFDLILGSVIDMQVKLAVPILMNSFLSLHEAVDWLGLSAAYPQILQIQQKLFRQVLTMANP
jgi:hypothetical protein